MKHPIAHLKNQSGAITVDYLFAFFLVSGLSLVIITFSATFSVVELVQYMTFAAARNYYAGATTEEARVTAAEKKFFELKSDPVVAPLLNGGWFDVPDSSFFVGNAAAIHPAYKDYQPAENRNLFYGVVVTLNAKILDFQIPFFGSTVKEDNSKDRKQVFSTFVNSFLGREPTFDNCREFFKSRWLKIKQLEVPSGVSPYANAGNNDNDYVAILSNGC